MWVIFCSNCVKLVTFFILHIYAKADEVALKVHLRLLNSRTVDGQQQDASDKMQLVWSFGLSLNMAKRAGRVGFGSGQSGCGSNGSWVKTSHFKQVKNGFGSIGLRVGSGRVDPYFHMIFFFFFIFIKKTTCICHLESYATNDLM